MDSLGAGRGSVLRAGVAVFLSTIVLTMSFIGILALLRADYTAVDGRLPFYLIVTGVVFVATILVLEYYGTRGQVIILTATVIGALSFVASLLSVEGVVYTIEHPERVIVDQLVYYFVAAGLICTGLGFWAVNHWREYVAPGRSR